MGGGGGRPALHVTSSSSVQLTTSISHFIIIFSFVFIYSLGFFLERSQTILLSLLYT